MTNNHSPRGAMPALDAFKSLENDLAEVKYAAGLAAGLLNHFPSYEKRPDGYVSVTLRIDDLEQLDFAVYEVQRRAKALNETYQAIELVEEAPAKAPARKAAAQDLTAVVFDAALDPVDARDRLNEGISLLKVIWLALSSDSIDRNDFQDFSDLGDATWQALTKFEDAKKGLAA